MASRCNSLDGKRWLSNSISVWSDLRKEPAEAKFAHPAAFPIALAARLIESFLPVGEHVVLDPFAGTGSTLVAAVRAGKCAVGFEISPQYTALARDRLSQEQQSNHAQTRPAAIVEASADEIPRHVKAGSIDLCITSPPYWNILNQKRTADHKAVRNYGNRADDLGTIDSYSTFLDALTAIFSHVLAALKPGAHCCVVVMDLRKKDRFFPLHSDLAVRLQAIGFRFDDLIVWNRQAEYNNLRPLGFPAVFRINKVHEFVLLMQKPRA